MMHSSNGESVRSAVDQTAPMSYAQRQRAKRHADVLTLIKLGRMTTQQIAYRMDVSTKLVERIKKDAGLTGRDRHSPLTTEQRARAECLLADGCSQVETARSVGCTTAQLRHTFPGRAWSLADKTDHENSTGLRQRTKPQLGRRTRRDGGEPAPSPFSSETRQ